MGQITKGEFGVYFLYALGELVLVILGILIALQINEWNESRRENALKEEYYRIWMKAGIA